MNSPFNNPDYHNVVIYVKNIPNDTNPHDKKIYEDQISRLTNIILLYYFLHNR
jgi:hypothetical protein